MIVKATEAVGRTLHSGQPTAHLGVRRIIIITTIIAINTTII